MKERGGGGIQNQKQEPHTKMWGTTGVNWALFTPRDANHNYAVYHVIPVYPIQETSMIATTSGKIRDDLLFATILPRIEIRAAT